MIQGAGHFVYDGQPKAFSQTVEKFLNALRQALLAGLALPMQCIYN